MTQQRADEVTQETALRQKVFAAAQNFFSFKHTTKPFVPGVTPVPVSGKVFGQEEMISLIDASLDFWLTSGRFDAAFEKRLANFLRVKHLMTVNSGSSANLLAVSALTSQSLGDKALKPKDEVITVAAGFPTTVNPLLLHGLVPVFVDVDIPTYNIKASALEEAITPRTKAIVLAHTLGNPFNLDAITAAARKHGLWLVEDCCDALGSAYEPKEPPLVESRAAAGPRLVGTFGHVGTLSFYPAHHITTGEGGAVFTQNAKLKIVLESMRDWGRDCFCETGKDNTCGKRFEWRLGELPFGYDHKYIYSELGYNLKMTDMQAAIGLAQMDRLPGFIEARKRNFKRLKKNLAGLEEFLILPEATPQSDPSWFGFPLMLRNGDAEKRTDLIRFLDSRKIGTRLLFGGNLTRQPYFKNRKYRISQALANTDAVMNGAFWMGVYPGLNDAMMDYVAENVRAFFKPAKLSSTAR